MFGNSAVTPVIVIIATEIFMGEEAGAEIVNYLTWNSKYWPLRVPNHCGISTFPIMTALRIEAPGLSNFKILIGDCG